MPAQGRMDALEMYAAYVRERTGAEVLIDPGKGFATWKMTSPDEVYIVDIYVAPEFRKSGVAAGLADRIAGVALATGASRLLGSVETVAETRTDALKALLAYGFAVDRVIGSVIWLSKEID